MFIAIVMACGFTAQAPSIVDSCALAYTERPIRTQTECLYVLNQIVTSIPEPAYRVYADCVELGTPRPNL